MSQFDPYYVWLGIPPKDQPADHYRLLGIERFENDLKVIESAADRQMAYVRTFQGGKHSAASQKILNELSAARGCLLVPETKAAYDRALRAAIAPAVTPVVTTPLPVAQPLQVPRSPTVPRLQPQLSFSTTRRRRAKPLWQQPTFYLVLSVPLVFLVVLLVVFSRSIESPATPPPVARRIPKRTRLPPAKKTTPVVPPLPGPETTAFLPTPEVAPPLTPQPPSTEAITSTEPSVAAEPPFALAPPRRLPVPTTEELREARQQVNQIFAQQTLAAQAPAERLLLAQTMFDRAKLPGDAPAVRYALALEASNLAATYGSTLVACNWLDWLPDRYEADTLALQIDLLQETLTGTDVQRPLVNYRLATLAATVVGDAARAAEQPSHAERAAFLAAAFAKRVTDDPALERFTAERLEQVKAGSPAETTGLGQGLLVQYYAGPNFGALRTTRIDRQIAWNWRQGTPDAKVDGNKFSARWTGWLRVPIPGKYRLVTDTDDGVRLRIDDQPVIEFWGRGAAKRRTAELTLSAGLHPFQMEFQNVMAASHAWLKWSLAELPGESPVPPSALWHDPQQATALAASYVAGEYADTLFTPQSPEGHLLRVFEDQGDLLGELVEGPGYARLDRVERYSGSVSVKVTGEQLFRTRLSGVEVKVREHPGPGEFRYLRFAWKKRGGQVICFKIVHDGKWGDTRDTSKSFRYDAGPAKELTAGAAIRVTPELPTEWTVVTRDMFADFGEFTFTGLSLAPIDGQTAWFDHIYLTRDLHDFEVLGSEK